MNYDDIKDLSDFTADEISAFCEQYRLFIHQIEEYINQNEELREYICDHNTDYSIYEISSFDDRNIYIQLADYDGPVFETQIPMNWITEGKWKIPVDTANAEKREKTMAHDRKAEAYQLKQDIDEFERLQKKLNR